MVKIGGGGATSDELEASGLGYRGSVLRQVARGERFTFPARA